MSREVVFAVDIGGSKLMCGLVDRDGNVIKAEKCQLAKDITVEVIENIVCDMYSSLVSTEIGCTVLAAGVNIPGLADPQNGMWVYACFSGISNYPIAESLGKKLNLPIFIENDVNACALAEKTWGNCRDCDNYLWVTVSNGVGGGLVLNGEVYGGAFGGAGEFGHIVVEENGPQCPCGHFGCIEAVAAGPAIAKRYFSLTGKNLSAFEISQKAREGDELSIEVFKKTGEYIGKGLGKVASILNLKRYVLGGGVMQSFDLMESSIKSAFQKEAFASPNKNAEICVTSLKYEAALLGAAAIGFKGFDCSL